MKKKKIRKKKYGTPPPKVNFLVTFRDSRCQEYMLLEKSKE